MITRERLIELQNLRGEELEKAVLTKEEKYFVQTQMIMGKPSKEEIQKELEEAPEWYKKIVND